MECNRARALRPLKRGVVQSPFHQWAASSVGRAPRSQRGGREFEPPAVHQPSLAFGELRMASQASCPPAKDVHRSCEQRRWTAPATFFLLALSVRSSARRSDACSARAFASSETRRETQVGRRLMAEAEAHALAFAHFTGTRVLVGADGIPETPDCPGRIGGRPGAVVSRRKSRRRGRGLSHLATHSVESKVSCRRRGARPCRACPAQPRGRTPPGHQRAGTRSRSPAGLRLRRRAVRVRRAGGGSARR